MRLRHMASVAAGLAVVGLVIAACSSFGGNDVAAPQDDGPSTSDGPTPDVSTPDGDPVDAEPRFDGPPVVPLCAEAGTRLTFCDDFERATPNGAWTPQGNTIPLFIDTSTATMAPSPTRSLKLVAPGSADAGADASADAGVARGYLTMAPKSTARRFTLAFSLRAATTGPSVQVATIAFDQNLGIVIEVKDGQVRIIEQQQIDGGGPVFLPSLFIPLASAHWTRFTLEVDLGAKNAVLHRDDGAADTSLKLTLIYGKAATVRIGAMFAESRTTPTTFNFDDVGFKAE